MRARRTKRWRLLAAALAGAVVAPACASDTTTDVVAGPPTPAFLSAAASQSLGASHRFDLVLSMQIPGVGSVDDVPLMRGEFDGQRQRIVMDLGALIEGMAPPGEALPPELVGNDLTMEMIVDGMVLYLRAPMFAAMAELDPGDPDLGALARLGTGWGRIDVAVLGDAVPADVLAALGGAEAYDPALFLEAVAGTSGVRELGEGIVGDVAVTGYAADVGFGDLMEAQGLDPDDLAAMFGEGDPGLARALTAMTMPIEVWVDGDAYVRRIVLDLGLDQILEMAAALDEELPRDELDLLGSFDMSMQMDFWDYADAGIVVNVPDQAEDLTAELEQLFDFDLDW